MNYISSTLTIYSVQADNAGQYTCYCSYNTSLLNVDSDQVIESDHKSATLSVHSGRWLLYYLSCTSLHVKNLPPDKYLHTSAIIIGSSIVLIFVLKLIYEFHHKKYMGNHLLEPPGRLQD